MSDIKDMLDDIEQESYIDSHSGIYDDEPSIYAEEDRKIIEAEREFAARYRLEKEKTSTAREFPDYDPEDIPKFRDPPTLGGCLSYLIFSGLGMLILWLIFGDF